MTIEFNSHDKELFMSFKGLVNRGGYFSSTKQADYFKKVHFSDCVHTGPCKSWGDSIEVAEGEFLIILEAVVKGEWETQDGMMKMQGWGRKTRFAVWGFLFDELGVKRMYRMKRRHDDSIGASWPNPDKTICEFERASDDDDKRLADLRKHRADRAQAIEDAKAQSKFVGEIGERIQIEGTARYITSFDGQWGTSYLYLIRDNNNNTIKYIGKFLGEGSFKISMVATVKKHEEYKGEMQTVINRPAKIETEEKACA